MDPQACLNQMIQAIIDSNIDTARERLFDLASWIQKGGFYPALAPPIMDIIERRREMQDDDYERGAEDAQRKRDAAEGFDDE